MLSGANLTCDKTDKGAVPAFVVGFDVAGDGGPVRATLRMPSGQVEFEIPNGLRFTAALSPSGQREWRRLALVLAARLGHEPGDFGRDLERDANPAPLAGPAPVASAPDTAVKHAAVPPFHPVVPDTPPMPIKKVPPRYPDVAREAGVDGTVMLSVLVGADGRVHDVRVVKGIPMLDAAAREAALQWVFEPGKRDGKAVDSWFELPIKFSLH
jgi:protein TonB